MAIIKCTPDNFQTAVAQAMQMDVVEMGPGTYPTLFRKAGITYRAWDWQPDRPLANGALGHLGAGYGVRLTQANASWTVGGWTMQGVFHDTRGSSAINAALVLADDIHLEECVAAARPASGARQIGYTIGDSAHRVTGFRFDRSRHHPTGQPGEALDHALYWKNCTGCGAADSIIYDGGRFPLHLYTNADGNVFERLIVWASVGCVTFSGATDTSTGMPGYNGSDNNTLRDSILGHAQKDVVASWNTVTGNVVDHCMLWPAPAPMPGTVKGVTITNCVQADPGFANAAAGDFTRARAWDGYGPRAVCRTTTPPPDPEPTRDELLAGDFTAIRNRLAGVEAWRNLTAAQRESIIAARRRAEIGLARLAE